MPEIISIGIRLLRICRQMPHIIEYSDNAGISWQTRFPGSAETGEFISLQRLGSTVFATTSTGRFRSVDGCAYWMRI